ncbi:galactokinase [Raphidocelis subcapitata]|uniref:Galactokinase n=1 Tax=Raphidocelis subcapitata TaxID=307507 RepID=A0A2V0NS67_9CHLO|nr:galactokinase [Raphidocelis subcapitata]|eukprot:GBF90169.1 galactokinase [Raphidocelis subcapitata]
MASDPVPEYKEIESVYGLEGAPAATHRLQRLAAAFRKQFGADPELFARAPGRVNLIGEHIDYEGYGVLPMALRLDTVVAIRRGGDRLVVANLDAEKFPVVEYGTDPAQAVDTAHHVWANYFLAAYKGVYDFLASKGADPPAPVGLQVMVHGVVPLAGGLSSSAAIVCSSALAVMAVRGVHPTKGEVADFTCKAERYVGVTSGGMDQAISVMGQPGVAKLVEFNPVRAEDVHLPPGATFVIANSLTVSKKQETADRRYNLRVVECRLAAALIARKLGAPPAAAAAVRTLREVEPAVAEKFGPGLKGKLRAVDELLERGNYLQDKIEADLGVPLSELFAGEPSPLRVVGVVAGEGFKLRDRAAHVYSEADRVYKFRAAAEDESSGAEALPRLGALMDASHASCARLYECSCPELDTLVGVAKAAGAIGSRLTGAGWGGCTVSLVRHGDVGPFMAALRENYYSPLLASGRVTEGGMGEVLFASPPSSGAAVLRIKLAPSEGEEGAAVEAPARERKREPVMA